MSGPSSCAVHPARPAVDACPVCGRGRCGPDVDAAPGGGCAACRGRAEQAPGPAVPPQERLVRAALAGYAACVLMGLVTGEYVGAGLFAYVTPFVLGVLCGEAVQRGAGTTRPEQRLRVLAAVYGVLGTALGFVVEGSTPLLSGGALLPYVAAAAGALLWTVPPGSRQAGASSRAK